MDRNVMRWGIDLVMGIVFAVSLVTGLLKLTLLLRLFGTTNLILPAARISDIHDGAGVILGVCVGLHLFMNRQWIITMTRQVLKGDRAGD
jgi:hypothetical protein